MLYWIKYSFVLQLIWYSFLLQWIWYRCFDQIKSANFSLAAPTMTYLSNTRSSKLKKVWARFKLLAVLVVLVMVITPLRNLLLPAALWPPLWSELHSLKVLRMHLFDLFVYVDRSPYHGSCEHVHRHLEPLKQIRPEGFAAYTKENWTRTLEEFKSRFKQEELWRIQHFQPSLTAGEQREMLHALLTLTRTLDIFNFTYFLACGTLIGAFRHHGVVPWDDDADLLLKASEWPLAREVLSCVPDFSLNMGSDYMWKFWWVKSKLWRDESLIRFPYIDIFLYNEDDDHIWPLTIWMKTDVLWRKSLVYPPARLPFEGYFVSVPRDPAGVLTPYFGDVNITCSSRIFKRREREPFPQKERIQMPCSYLHELYPFVFQTIDYSSGISRMSVQVRKIGFHVMSTYKP